MNDLTLLIVALLIFVIASILGVVIMNVTDHVLFGYAGMMIGVLAFCLLRGNPPINNNAYDSIPYNGIAEESYELKNLNDSPFFLTGEDNTITFFDADGISHTVEYYEMESKDSKDGAVKIEIYGRADDGIEWFNHLPRKKVVIYMPE